MMSVHLQHTALFQKIYTDTYEKVFHFMHRLTARNDALTDDLVQNVYIRLWEKMEQITPDENCLPLLYTIARGQLIDHHRKILAEHAKLTRWQERQPASGTNTATGHLTFKEIAAGVEKALSRMPPRRREIFLLCREEGLSHREIATRMNMSVHSIEQQMNLALKSLKKELRHFEHGEMLLPLVILTLSLDVW